MYPSDQVELVEYTASTQWDALLAVAEDWAKIDRSRREEDTSEEEASENWLADENEEGKSRCVRHTPHARERADILISQYSSALSDAPESDVPVERAGRLQSRYRERSQSEEAVRPAPKRRRVALASESEPEPEGEAGLPENKEEETQAQPNGEPSTSGYAPT